MLIHVACPNCSEPYDIADTFAGGVYRCTKCNTLMSVPKKYTPPAGTAVGPGMSRAASPDAFDDLDAMGDASSRASSSSKAKMGSRQPAKAPSRTAGKPVAGKAPVRPGQKKPQPAGLGAYKWHFVSFAVLLVVVIIIVIIARKERGETKVIIDEKAGVVTKLPESPYRFPYAIGVLLNDKPNVMGLPLDGNVAVVIDGTSSLNGVRPALHKLLGAGLTNKPYDKPSASFIYANGETGGKIPSLKAMPVNAADGPKAVQDFLGKTTFVPAKRDDISALKDALQLAVDQIELNQTRHIVLVVGRNITPYAQGQLLKIMENAKAARSTHFDLVVIDADIQSMTDLRDMVSSAQGKTVPVAATTIQNVAGGLK